MLPLVLFIALLGCSCTGWATDDVPIPAECGGQPSKTIASHLEPASDLVGVSCLAEGDTLELRVRSRTYTSEFSHVWVIEYRGPYHNIRTGVRGDGCWYKIVVASTGMVVGTGGGPCKKAH